jgi:hypothetical protein
MAFEIGQSVLEFKGTAHALRDQAQTLMTGFPSAGGGKPPADRLLATIGNRLIHQTFR